MKKLSRGGHAASTNRTSIEKLPTSDLRFREDDPRRFSDRDIDLAIGVIARLPEEAPWPVFVNETNQVLVGGIFLSAARKMGTKVIPIVRHVGLTELEQKHFAVAVNQTLSKGDWDPVALGNWVQDFEELIEDFSQASIGFANGELDKVLAIPDLIIGTDANQIPAVAELPLSRRGMIWLAGPHRVMIGDATDPADMEQLMSGTVAAAAVTDAPYGCEIDGFVSKKGKHRNFVEASGEKSAEQLAAFFLLFVPCWIAICGRAHCSTVSSTGGA